MFNKILIANRGEIAVRVIRACREMNIHTVAVYSEADKNALHVQMADEAICIGPPRAQDSYLNMTNIISAAYCSKAQAIHPGFGFLAENSIFAAMCRECNIKFIGPTPDTMDLIGNKSNARELMKKHNVPVVPGSEGVLQSPEDALRLAREIGYPVMIKASAGGGGKGIRIVREESSLERDFSSAKAEAGASFGDDGLYMEKVIERARHIEVQILADEFGNTIHLGERDCSLQRRNQKVLEESPSVAITAEKRAELGAAAVRAAKAADYVNAGTIEFLYEDSGNFYFMEMNTRIQVEHPVTEMVTGIDLIKEQIKIAAMKPLSLKQEDVKFSGHSIECRINAEAPARNFAPSPGTINYLFMCSGGPGIRVDSAVYAGYTIPPYYDSMIAKIITHGSDRAEAISKMRRAINETVIRGVDSNLDFQMKILQNEKYLAGDFYTRFIEDEILSD